MSSSDLTNAAASPSPSPNTTRPRAPSSKVYLYSEFLGVDLKRYPFLYDLMEEGLRCPLPEGWKIRKLDDDDDGNPCHDFVHEASGKVSNAHPMDEVFLTRAETVIRKHQKVVANRRVGETKDDGSSSVPAKGKQQQLSENMWKDSMSDNDDDAHSKKNNNKNKKSIFRSGRTAGSSIGSKQFRYAIYIIVFGAIVHFITYQAVYKVVVEMYSKSNNRGVENRNNGKKIEEVIVEQEVEEKK